MEDEDLVDRRTTLKIWGPRKRKPKFPQREERGRTMERRKTRGAHHRLGIVERNHAVRRKVLETFKAEMPDCSFKKALLVTAHQRNRLSSAKGATPATLAFGNVPSEDGVMDDPGPESFGDQADLPNILEIKQKAVITFHKANQDLALRAAALHRSRVEDDELFCR